MSRENLAVELINVSKHFVSHVAVEGATLQIGQGDFFSMLGPSGCGKTTTLRMIAGFESPTSGTIRLMGQDVQKQPPHRRNINMVFQNYALFPHMTVFDNVAFGLAVKRVPRPEIRRRVGEALEMVRLPGMDHRKPTQLSGGQQQRVALARALVNHPGVLLLDEPLGALDLKLRKDMQLELKRLQREVGITFIYVTHDQEEALTMSDHIAVMHQGRVLQVDQPSVIYERPATRFVADFIGSTNFLEGSLLTIENGTATVEVAGVGTIRANPIDGAVPGQKVTLAIRPERMQFADSSPVTGDNQVQGTIAEVVFIGNDTQYFVSLMNGSRIMVRQQNRVSLADAPAMTPGQVVTVLWSASSTNVLSE